MYRLAGSVRFVVGRSILPQPRAVTAALDGRFAPMAIRATNDAFVDLGLQTGYGCSADNHAANVVMLRTTYVIEVEDDNVLLATIDTWMFLQMFDDETAIMLGIYEMKRIATRVIDG
jgi:hypothetical protein